jgi:hypothetical protein
MAAVSMANGAAEQLDIAGSAQRRSKELGLGGLGAGPCNFPVSHYSHFFNGKGRPAMTDW